MKIFELSKEHLPLAIAEVSAFAGGEAVDNLFIGDSRIQLHNRLGYCHNVYEFILRANSVDEIKSFEWESVVKKDFSVRSHDVDEKEFAAYVWRTLKNPKVKLKNPESEIWFFKRGNEIIAGRMLHRVDKGFLQRKAHLRPYPHPTSMDPRLARACINLAGIEKGRLCDPFCGSGGILIEAGLMGYDITGYDIAENVLDKCRLNLKHYGLKAKLELKDALTMDEKFDLIVTDLPYGKGSRKTLELKELYERFLETAKAKSIVVVVPDNIEIKHTGFDYRYYVHKSLTRRIVKLR